jgi:hypothetical protein
VEFYGHGNIFLQSDIKGKFNLLVTLFIVPESLALRLVSNSVTRSLYVTVTLIITEILLA